MKNKTKLDIKQKIEQNELHEICFLSAQTDHFDSGSVMRLLRQTAKSLVQSGRLTLMRWKLTLQLAPAREGMKRSPCLLGEDRGELVGVRDRTAPTAFYTREERRRHFLTGGQTETGLGHRLEILITKQEDNLCGRWCIHLRR